jgi:hypothetical protein
LRAFGGRRQRVFFLVSCVLSAAAAASGGCVTIGRTTTGSSPSAEATIGLNPGAPISLVLRRLGAPTETWRQPEGLILLYRKRTYDYDRLGFEPSRAIAILSLDPILGDALSNLKLTLERANLLEERVAVLFDRDNRVVAVAHRDCEGRRLR